MIKKFALYGTMIIAIIFMIVFLMKDNTVEITKEDRKRNYSVGLKEGEKLQVNVAAEIIGAIKHREIWDRLFLSEKFKNKFKNPKDIIPNISEYSWFGGGNCYDYKDKNVIVIFADKKDPLIELSDYEPITTEFYFEYFMDENNEIDDIKLLKKIDTYASSGRPIDE